MSANKTVTVFLSYLPADKRENSIEISIISEKRFFFNGQVGCFVDSLFVISF